MSFDILPELETLTPASITRLSDEDLLRLAQGMLEVQSHDRQVNQLRYYQPVSQTARSIHGCTKKVIGVGGGNGASKTDTALVELCIRATGQIPLSLKEVYPREKLRGPINCRVVVESITNTLETIILPKLRWDCWQGVDAPGGARGHFGWVPKHCLRKGSWEESWTARTRILEVLYYSPETGKFQGYSRIQFMSYDQDPADFASGDFHFILHDEPPKEAIWIENLVRAKRVDGTMMMSMTWPDDPTTPVDWIIDRVYEPAQPGRDHDESYAWFDMYATDNQNLNQTALAELARSLTAEEKARRIYGQHLRLSTRVHPLFTDTPHEWCFSCHDLAIRTATGACGRCGGEYVSTFTHVQPVLVNPTYPCLQLLDPHPRKPHMLCWLQVTPNDDLEQVAELEIDDTPLVVWQAVQDLEAEYGWSSIARLMDPNMGRSPSGTERNISWQDAFDQVGMRIDLADDGEVGRRVLNEYLKPDEATKRPRYIVDPRCMKTIYQMKRYAWDDHKRSLEKDQKQKAKQKHDDFPTMLKYAVNASPSFRGLKSLGAPLTRVGHRSKGY